MPFTLLSDTTELTQVPWRQGGSRCAGGLRGVGVEDGAVCLVVDQVGHVSTLLVLGEADGITASRAQVGLEVGVAVRGVTADWTLVSAMRAWLEEQHRVRAGQRQNMHVWMWDL